MTVTLSDIRAAREVIKDVIVPTPTLPDEKLSDVIGAQAYLQKFYESFGFVMVGEPYIEDGIPHIYMIRKS